MGQVDQQHGQDESDLVHRRPQRRSAQVRAGKRGRGKNESVSTAGHRVELQQNAVKDHGEGEVEQREVHPAVAGDEKPEERARRNSRN